ncbi:hypothetical protein [Winogradskyella sediminis]|uniref:Uncharacterized protein n=1 Tax=Winogradskyella sediminis TaxID=1382466 RepID=A0A1H1LYJ8_9FLAO|nr:hypothetical protein [Winogradskyella sediminis]SDR79460.1 hypothetical protein SAMN04489797_0142 [Winogradskyella sediminis]
MKKIKLTRDNVTLGDDVNAPHFLEIEIAPNWTITEIIKYILNINYLPKISGGYATWSVAIEEPIAVLTQKKHKEPLLLCFPDYPYDGTQGFVKIEHVHFNYHAQKKAHEVFEVLSRFKIKTDY